MTIEGLTKPKRLHGGDKIAAVTLSWGGPGTFPQRYAAGVRQLKEAFGVEVVEMPNTFKGADWIQANPQARADDLMEAFADPEIKGIISTIGGEDSIRLLPYLDLDVIRENPKVLMGYSDTTITHFACLKAGLVSFYGPAIMAGFGENGGLFAYMEASVRRTVFSSEVIGELKPNRDGWTAEHLNWANPENQERKRKLNPCSGWRFLQGKGIHSGYLIGGCVEVLDWLRGTDWWPSPEMWEEAMLFIETSEEAPTPLTMKRILRAFTAAGVIGRIKGVLFGRPGGEMKVEAFDGYDAAILDVVVKEAGRSDIPVVTGMDFGHTDPMMVLPYGVECVIDCDKKKIAINESAVTTTSEKNGKRV